MNVRFLEAFVWVAKLGSFKAAAEKLHTTQAGISSRIATLEEQFGVRLFEREHRGVMLNRHGTELMPHAERMIELQARMMAAMGQPEAFAGMLRIGVIETIAHTWLPALLSRFAERYPNATLELISDTTPRLRDELLRGTLDCAVLSEEITQGFIDNRRLANFAMGWVASPARALTFPTRTQLSFADIAQHPIISFHRESSVYRNIAQNTAGCANLRVSYFSSLGAMVDMARSGFGAALLPIGAIQQDLEQGRLVLLDVTPTPAPLPLVASFRMEPASPMAEALVAMAQSASDDFVAASRPDILAP
jgi:DNA-binding transcriptional LysR family regulator